MLGISTILLLRSVSLVGVDHDGFATAEYPLVA